MSGSSHVYIKNVDISMCKAYGRQIFGNSQVEIRYSNITSCGATGLMLGASNATVIGCIVSYHRNYQTEMEALSATSGKQHVVPLLFSASFPEFGFGMHLLPYYYFNVFKEVTNDDQLRSAMYQILVVSDFTYLPS